jgi:hypothetical protein
VQLPRVEDRDEDWRRLEKTCHPDSRGAGCTRGVFGREEHEVCIHLDESELFGGHFKTILVLGINGKAVNRAEFEDRLSAEITRPGIAAIPSYSLLPRPNSTPLVMSQLRDVVQGQNIDAIIATRLIKVKKSVTEIPGQLYTLYPYHDSFYGYYGTIYPEVYSPDYLRVERTAQIETNFYSTLKPDGELIWTETSDTVNPQSPSKAIDAVAKLIVETLEKQKII